MTIVAFIDQSSYKICHSPQEVPPGSVQYSSPEDLMRGLPIATIDKIIAGVLHQSTVVHSQSHFAAANRLWYLLTLGEPTKEMSKEWSIRKDSFGNPKYMDASGIELIELCYVPGKDSMVDLFFKKLPAQAKKIYEILKDDGRGIWTNAQALELVIARGAELKTKQGPGKVFDYYRSEMFLKKILRRLTYAEFSQRQNFSELFNTDSRESKAS
jgi:hypothetical protein